MADIDIDFPTKFEPNCIFKNAVAASMVKDNDLVKHPCGYYFQAMPIDTVTKLAAIPYEEAEVLGYFKIDFLHLSALDYFNSKQEIRELIAKEPDWTLLLSEENVSKLFQLKRHHDLLRQVRPQSVNEVADCIALIRPNKKHLVNEYLKNRKKTAPLLYRQGSDDKSSFRKSHAVAYALTVVLQLHLISQGKL